MAEPEKKRLRVGLGEETDLPCPLPQCGGTLRWKPDPRQKNQYFLGCSNYRINHCKAKGCSGKAFEGGTEVEISGGHAVGSAHSSSQSTEVVARTAAGPAEGPAPSTPDSYKRDLASALESPVKGLASGIATRMTDEEQQVATKASAEEAINIAAKSKGIAQGDTKFMMHLIEASALEEVAVNVHTAIEVKEREMKHAKKYRTAKQAKMEILSKLAQKEIKKAERQHVRIPDIVVQVQEGDAAEDQEIDVDKLIADELAGWLPASCKPEIRSLCIAQVRSFLLCPRCSGASKSAAHLPTCFKSSGFARCRSEKQDVLCFTALLAKDILQKKAEASVGGLEFDRRYQWRFEGWQGHQRALKDIMKEAESLHMQEMRKTIGEEAKGVGSYQYLRTVAQLGQQATDTLAG